MDFSDALSGQEGDSSGDSSVHYCLFVTHVFGPRSDRALHQSVEFNVKVELKSESDRDI